MRVPELIPAGGADGRRLPVSFGRLAILLCLLAFGAACAGPYPGPLQDIELPPREVFSEWASLAPNDKLRVTVWQHPEASTPSDGQRIDPSGVLVLPLLGPLELAGLTSQGARALIEEHAAQFIRAPKVTISVLEFGARDFYVLGQIQNVGPQRIDRPLNALQALSYGGPFLPGAARGSVYLLREGDGRLNVHPFDASQPGANSLMAVRPNDVIFVPMSGHGRFAEDVLPYLQGIGLASTFPVALHAVTE